MSGKRNLRAQFQEQVKTKDAAGETIESWVTKYRTFVSVKSLGSDAQSEDAANYQVSQFELTAVYSKRLEQFMSTSRRVILKDKAYRVTQIGDVFSRQTLSYVIELYE